ncbi:MAG: trigger factor [Planctomycetales bacterium]|nr:trigger factor [Planctomycetales bacterium]
MSTSEATDPSTEAASLEKQKLTLDVKIDKPSACERHIAVTIARDDVDRYLTEAIDELTPKAAVPGFRNGKAPRKLVENRFRKELSDQIKGSLVMDSISQITESEKLSAISEPKFDYEVVEVPDEGPMKFEFDIEVRPDFDLPKWQGLNIEKPTRKYGPEDVEKHLRKMLRRHAEMVDKDGPVEAGDYVTVDVAFSKDGAQVSELLDETVFVAPTLSFFDAKVTGFAKLMEGAKPGDVRECKVKISADAEDESLRGAEVNAAFKVAEVHRMELPELDDSMLERLGGFENEGDLRDAVQQHLERQLKYHQDQRVRTQIADVLTGAADWDLPPDLLRRQSARELQRAVLELRSSGFSDSEILAHEAELRQNSQASTAKALKEHFILERIAEDREIEAEPADYDLEVAMIAAQSGESPRRVRARLEKQDLMDTLRNQIIERKVIGLITAEAKFKEVPYTPEEGEVETVDHFVAGEPAADIPEAKHADAEALRQPAERS